jgi:hypothetical protein
VLQPVAAAIASDDAACLPISDVVKKSVVLYAYLANEQLIDVVGG